MVINQDINDFRAWLMDQPDSESAIAGDPCECWLAKYFESQGFRIWGVFPQHYIERLSDAPGGASQEILLDDPSCPEFNDSDRVALAEWAYRFGAKIDLLYHSPFESSIVTRNHAISVLGQIEDKLSNERC